ncbi:sigma-70 family RNA polymerase sigma factor [Stieleria sp. ICT_E10.1]|uniref:RNA polymerase sigma factor n=1 Tax=Stieleria sedimenti TaxID=2976331 RepID=UPI00217FB4BE|nr:sigma-70 family RNA polymerase sigma factor [Stieleria sedimenti]MCS7470528.1 sigma-70 family RNA polymerase sigma factor [Stieleria sedimenti]
MSDNGASRHRQGSSEPPSQRSVDFAAFQSRLQRGETDAVRKLFDDYSRRLVCLAGKNIHPALLKRFDGEDIVQSVFRTFFRRHGAGGFQIEHSQQLWQLLATLTLCKTRSHARKHTADCRDAQAEHAISEDLTILAREPSAEDALALWEEIDLVIEGLPPKTGEIIALRLEGRTKTEIAGQLSVSRQTIHRILNLVLERLEHRFALFSDETATNSEKDSDSM